MFLLIVALVTVSGVVVVHDGTPLPGATVTITSGTLSRTKVTNEHGRYSFSGVSEGTWDLRSTLEGFEPAEQRVTVVTVAREDVVVPPQELRFGPIETITIACGSLCADEPPVTPYDLPLCSEFELHTEWMNALRDGDRSTVPLLRTRYAQALSLHERYRLGDALKSEDAGIFGELMAAAAVCTEFPKVDGELTVAYLEWASARQLPPEDAWNLSYDALGWVASDPRSRALLLQLLDSTDSDLVFVAISGLSEQRDLSALPSIRLALARFPDHASSMALGLARMHSPAADELAMQYVDGRARDEYARVRANPSGR